MSQYLNRWRLSALAVLTALAVATATPAFAQGQPGEFNFYTVKKVHTAGNLYTEGSLAEARNNGNLLSAWKADDNTNQVWLSYNNGSPFTISPRTQTFVRPAVVAIGTSNFLVFHTGIDGQIYYAIVVGDHEAGGWIPIPGQTSNMAVSAAQIGGNANNVYMVYRGSGHQRDNLTGLLRRSSLQCRCRLLGDQAIPYLIRVPS